MKTPPVTARNVRPLFWSRRSLGHTACRHGRNGGFARSLALGLGLVGVGLSVQSAQAQNVTDTYIGAAGGDWSVGTNWSLGTPPASNNDVLFTTGSGATSTINGENFTIGSFDSTIAEAVTDGSATASTLTLGGGSATTDQVPGSNPADLIFVSALSSIGATGTGALNLVLGQSGQFDSTTGTAATVGLIIGKAGSTLSLGTSTTAPFTLTLTGELPVPNAGGISILSTISGTGSIVKTGNNQAALGAANTFTGGVTIEQGNLNPSNATALGTGASAIALGDATSVTSNLSPFMLLSGNTTITRAVTVGASNGATTGFYTIGSGNGSSQAHVDGTFTLNQNFFVTTAGGVFTVGDIGTAGNAVTSGSTGTQTVNFNNGGNLYVGAVVGGGTGTIAVTKVSGGTAFLAAADTYTGTTTVNQGTLSLAGSLTNSPALAVGGGTFTYNPGTFTNTAGLTGTTNPTFTATTGGTQTMSGVTVNTGGSLINVSAGNTLNLGAITRSGNGTVGFTPTGTITTSSAGANGILGPYAYTGATTTLSYVTPGTIAAYTAGTAAATAANVTDTTGTLNYNVAAAGVITPGASPTSANTLRYTGAAGTISGGPVALNGLMNAGTGLLTVSSNVTAGANNELIVLSNAQGVTLSGLVSDNGSATALTYGGGGAGTLTLSNFNTYTGGTTVNTGTLALTGGSGGGAGNVVGALTVNNGATVNLTGNNALGFTAGLNVTTVNVNLGGTVNSTAAGSVTSINQGFLTNFVLTGGTVSSTGGGSFNFNVAAATPPTISSNASTGLSTFSAPIVIRNTGTLAFNVASGVIGQDPRTAIDLTVTGTILKDNVNTASVGGISKSGAGVLALSNAGNTYNGGTSISAGTLLVTGTGTLGTGNVTVSNTGALTLDSTGTATAIAGSATLNFSGTTIITLNNAATDTLTNIVDTDGTSTFVPAAGTYTAALLDTDFGVTSFIGAGTLTVVPEPSTWLGGLLIAGTFGLALRRRVGARIG